MTAPAPPPAGWHGRLELHYRVADGRTVAHDRHAGPLRVLKSLYPEGPQVCQQVLVHPPGGIVGGDTLDLDVRLDPGAHALLTTPGATRFYRSAGAPAAQRATLRLGEGARLEWLPLEAIAFDGCLAENRVTLALEPGAQAIGWDLVALGLPASGQPFARGRFVQHLEWPGVWLERGALDAGDRRLLDSPLGLARRGVLGALWFASAVPLASAERDALLEAARADDGGTGDDGGAGNDALLAGATAPDERLVLLRVLAKRVEPAMRRFVEVWSQWRRLAWRLPATAPRIWRT